MIELFAGLLMGIAGSLHCIGMCGPLVALSTPQGSRARMAQTAAQYHLGRVGMYVIIGLFLSVSRNAAQIGHYASIISITAGVGMIAVALIQLLYHRSILPDVLTRPLTKVVLRGARTLASSRLGGSPILRGMLNGLLPCGLSVSAFIASLTLPAPWQAVLFLAGFGVGTSPGLWGATALGRLGMMKILGSRSVAPPLLVVVSGLLVMIRGLSLGIPLLSPDINHALFHSVRGCCTGH
jgi:sulfite exporter TauE/SafE